MNYALSNFLIGLAYILQIILTAFYWLILIRALISWVNPDPYNPIVRFLVLSTEPILGPLRRILPFALKSAIDFSPLIAFLIIMFLKMFLIRTLLDFAAQIRPSL